MNTPSAARGTPISAPEICAPEIGAVEIGKVSADGFWLLIDGTEAFLPFEQFPWFRDASIAKLARVERASLHHLYWPDLDVDLAVESIFHPERFPLVSRIHGAGPAR